MSYVQAKPPSKPRTAEKEDGQNKRDLEERHVALRSREVKLLNPQAGSSLSLLRAAMSSSTSEAIDYVKKPAEEVRAAHCSTSNPLERHRPARICSRRTERSSRLLPARSPACMAVHP